MSQAKKPAQPGDTVELKDKDTGFYDSETKLQIVRDQQVELGETIGKRTNEAIMSGGLLIVSSKSATAKTGSKTANDLPDDLPGREAFAAAKMDLAAVKAFDFEKDKVEGVGAKTIEAVQAYLKK